MSRHSSTKTSDPCVAWLAWLLVLFLLAPAAFAQSGHVVVGKADRYLLTSDFLSMEDPGAALELADILKPSAQASFKPVKSGAAATNFGLTHSAFWLRISLDVLADAPSQWLFEVAYPPLDHLDLYIARPDGSFERQAGGDLLSFTERKIPHRNHVLPVTLQPGQANTIYLRVTSEGTVAAPVRLWQPAALWRHDQLEYSVLSLYFGMLTGLFLYNLLLFVSLRDRVYLFYVAFVAWIAIAQASLTGMGAQFLWPQWPWWIMISISASNAASGVFGILFARDFLSSKSTMPMLDKLLQVEVVLWLLAVAAAIFLPYVVSVWMVTVLAIVTVTSLVLVGVLSVKRRHPGARYFLVAWAVLLLGVAVLALHNTGFLPSNPMTANALMIGSALEMVLLSFGLGNRINVAIAEKEQAQARSQVDHAMVEALRESQDQYRTVLQERETILATSIVGIVFLSPDGRFRWANQAMMDIFASTDKGVTTMEPFYRSREEYLRVGGEVAACIARGEVYQTEIQVRQGNGNMIWVSLSGKAVVKGDLTQGTVWVMTDISLRKALEAELLKTSSEREAILNSALVGIVLSVARRHEWVNDKFAQMMGYPREEMIGQSSEHYHLSREAWNAFGREARAALVTYGTHTAERQLVRRNGEVFWAQLGGSCIQPNDPEAGVIWTFLDITERKKSEEDTREALQQQRELNELRSRFVAMTSHEFRTPLSSILSAQELLKHYGERLPEAEKAEILESISAGVHRMMRMLDRVLLIGKADAQMLDFEPRLLDLKPLCEELVDEARAQQPGTLCKVRLQFAGELTQGAFDEKLLRHIFSNLLSNAIKYSPEGGEVGFDVSVGQGITVFEVSDQGIGIPPDEISHLFESFHRASNVGAIAGTGLGLAIVKNAVDVHGGTIDVSSVPGDGTRFIVRLPSA
ncbi:MAG: 7TM diverse intracellular signaling domain-containing protein [Pseudomonadota bacterium]